MKKFHPSSEFIVLTVLILAIAAIIIWPTNEYVRRLSDNSTAILALLTTAYVALTYLLLKSTKASIEEQHRPYVVASVPVDKFTVFCRIENSGDRPAYSVKVKFTPGLETLSGDRVFRGMAEPLMFQSFLPPHFAVQNMISTTIHALSVPLANRVFSVFISYADAKGKQYSDSY